MRKSWLRRLNDQKKQVSRFGLIPAHQNFMEFGGENDKSCGLPEIWKVNGEKNIKWLDKNKDKIIGTVHDMPSYEGKAIIFAGLGPSINHQWKALKNIDDRFIIIATNSSAEFLIKRDIIPHYIIAIDGRPGNWTLDLGDKCKDVVGIFSVCVEPESLMAWPGKIMIVPYGVDDKSLNGKIKRRFGKPVSSGGSAMNNAAAIFVECTKARIFIYAGHDLSFTDNYYADRESKNDESVYFWQTDVTGEKVKTLIPLYEYKIWLENMMVQLFPEYHFFNCSEGILGVDVDGSLLPFVTQSSLEDAIQETKEALNIEESPLEDKLKYIYDAFYDHDFGNLQRGVGIWRFVTKFYDDFNKGLDVGCGRANGVQFSRENGFDVYGCDISDAAMKCWKERGVSEYCKVAPANKLPYKDQEFDFIVCSEVLEHIPEENINDTLKEIFRVGSDKYLFTIALGEEKIKIAGYIQTHITIKSPEWWFRIFGEIGYHILGASHDKDFTDLSIMAVKDEGPYLRGEKKMPVDDEGKPIIVVVGCVDSPDDTAFFMDGQEVQM